ncbi:MAG: S41 family peptidase, partial [Bacteroidota bacterium]|nr:S41 family peptidase [Bacteroidota bacterium]
MTFFSKYSKSSIKVTALGIMLIIISVGLLSFSESRDFKLVKNLEVFSNLFRELNYYYVDSTDPEKLIQTGINAMLKTLDPYTVYISEEDLDDFKFTTTGHYGGVGSLIRKKDDYVLITDIYQGFPADKSGLKTGDLIMSVDGISIKGMSSSEVSGLLKGLPGSTVEISVSRYGNEETVSFTLERKEINVPNVPYYGLVGGGVGYIRLSNFRTGSGKEVRKALSDLKNNYGAEAIILDLRGNPGGLLTEAVSVSNLFVPRGEEIVSTRGKVEEYYHSYQAPNQPVAEKMPLAVLVDRGSASAAEIVAGSLQDLDRGIIVGGRTYGKGLVQTTRPLGYNNQLKVTTAKYYIPSGRCIQAVDYSNRNEDGSVGHVPDSLISMFKTRNGRVVYDGGGILPDVEVVPANAGLITINLYTQDLFFDYSTKFASENPEILPASDFEFSEENFLAFCNFVIEKDFHYEIQSNAAYESLVKAARKDNLYENNKEAFLHLKTLLKHDLKTCLKDHKEEIIQFLTSEIAGRYYYQAGGIESSLKWDKDIVAAKKV